MQEGIAVSLANLQLIGTRLNRCMDSVDVQLDELAREVTREKENPEDLLVTLSELKGAGIPSVAWVSFLQKVSRRLQQNGGLHICLPPSLLPEAPMQGAAGRIAYVRNPLSETAYGRFLSFLPEAAGNAFDHFQDICEEVYNGICEYCLLPVSNSSEGRLSRFCGMILKYDLKMSPHRTATGAHGLPCCAKPYVRSPRRFPAFRTICIFVWHCRQIPCRPCRNCYVRLISANCRYCM